MKINILHAEDYVSFFGPLSQYKSVDMLERAAIATIQYEWRVPMTKVCIDPDWKWANED